MAGYRGPTTWGRRVGADAGRDRGTPSRGGDRAPKGLPAPAPPRVHELVHHLHQLPHGAALLHDVAGGGVERHDAVADAPAPLPLRVQPDDALHPLADLAHGPRLRVVVVVARISQAEQR